MNKVIVWLLAGLTILSAGFLYFHSVDPNSRPQKFRIGIINPNRGTLDINKGFVDGLAQFGYRAGDNITFVEGQAPYTDLDKAVQDIVNQDVDLIFSVTTPATRKIKQAVAGKNIPIIFALYNPVQSGIVKSLTQPGENLTGIQISGSVPKALEWLIAVVPDLKHLYVPITFDTKAARQSLEPLQQITQSLGIRLTVAEINNVQELDMTLASLPEDIDAIFIIHSIFISSHAKRITEEAIKRRIPTGAAIGKGFEGVIISFSPELHKIGEQASRQAALVLQGQSASEIPGEIAHFSLNINLVTADSTGITIPDDVLLQADHVFR